MEGFSYGNSTNTPQGGGGVLPVWGFFFTSWGLGGGVISTSTHQGFWSFVDFFLPVLIAFEFDTRRSFFL